VSLLIASKTSKLTVPQVEAYLTANRRNAASLLAAFRTTDDPALLQEAIEKFPHDAQVAFEAFSKKDSSTTERVHWLESLKQAAPDNALPNYYSALQHFQAGETDQAVQELTAASAKAQFEDYAHLRVQNDFEAYQAAGRAPGEALLAAVANLRVPHLAAARELGRDIVELANTYEKAGDEPSHQAALEMALNFGRRFSGGAGGETLMAQLVGLSVEQTALRAMDPTSPYGPNRQTVQSRLEQLGQQRAAIRELNQKAEPVWPTLSDPDWAAYLARSQVFGEQQALGWLVNKFGQN
jgi:hypothetical protein